METKDTLKETLREILNPSPQLISSEQVPGRASVAIVMRERNPWPDLLFIQRTVHPNDPWSGQMAFPGGRHEEKDTSDQHTAERETFEEVGIDLAQATYLGALNQIQARKAGLLLPFRIAPFVYWSNRTTETKNCAKEVAATHWIPLAHFFTRTNHVNYLLSSGRIRAQLPAIEYGENKIWGLTYMMLTELMERLKNTAVAHQIHAQVNEQTKPQANEKGLPLEFWRKYPAHTP